MEQMGISDVTNGYCEVMNYCLICSIYLYHVTIKNGCISTFCSLRLAPIYCSSLTKQISVTLVHSISCLLQLAHFRIGGLRCKNSQILNSVTGVLTVCQADFHKMQCL